MLIAWLVYLLVSPTIGFGWIDSWHNEQRAVQVALLCASTLPFALFGTLPSRCAGGIAANCLLLVFVFLASGLFLRFDRRIYSRRSPKWRFSACYWRCCSYGRVSRPIARNGPLCGHAISRCCCAAGYVLGVAVRWFAAIRLAARPDLDVLILDMQIRAFRVPCMPS